MNLQTARDLDIARASLRQIEADVHPIAAAQPSRPRIFLLTPNRERCTLLLATYMADAKSDVLHGTLALMALKTLDLLGPLHGYGIARRIEQISGDALELNQGTLYPCLLRLEQMGWISSQWGASDNNRRARYYSITRAGRKRLAAEAENWEKAAAIVARFLGASGEAL